MKWLLDVNVTKGVLLFLENGGADVTTLTHLGLRRLPNGAVLRKAKELDRILLTYDKGFILYTQGEHPGVVVVRIHPNFDDNVLPAIKKLLALMKQREVVNHLFILEVNKIIVRKTS